VYSDVSSSDINIMTFNVLCSNFIRYGTLYAWSIWCANQLCSGRWEPQQMQQ